MYQLGELRSTTPRKGKNFLEDMQYKGCYSRNNLVDNTSCQILFLYWHCKHILEGILCKQLGHKQNNIHLHMLSLQFHHRKNSLVGILNISVSLQPHRNQKSKVSL